MVELVDHRAVCPLRRKRANMGFEKNSVFPRPAPPVGGAPDVTLVFDHLAGTGNIVRLEGRSGIWHGSLAVDQKAIARTRVCICNVTRKPSVRFTPHLERRAGQQHIDALYGGRPESERGAV